eukprot:3443477-Amphidinium_carterae.1
MPSAVGPPSTKAVGLLGAVRGLACVTSSPCHSLFQACTSSSATSAGPAAHFPSRETARFHTSVLPRSHLYIFLGASTHAS